MTKEIAHQAVDLRVGKHFHPVRTITIGWHGTVYRVLSMAAEYLGVEQKRIIRKHRHHVHGLHGGSHVSARM